jgi:hypothetical protein
MLTGLHEFPAKAKRGKDCGKTHFSTCSEFHTVTGPKPYLMEFRGFSPRVDQALTVLKFLHRFVFILFFFREWARSLQDESSCISAVGNVSQ